jgi:hypothetical protein
VQNAFPYQRTFKKPIRRLLLDCIRDRADNNGFISKLEVIRRRCDRFLNQNKVSHNRREDTRSPVRNGASRRQSLIVRCWDSN